jgi:hypothetical protein
MTPAYVNPYLCADVWNAVRKLQPCTTEDVAIKLLLEKGAASKILNKLKRRGYIVARKKHGKTLIYHVHPQSQCPVDKRQVKSAKPRLVPVPKPPQPFWLGHYWKCSPYGQTTKSSIVDTFGGKVYPEYSEAAD